jgi:predicted nuclease of restriction endonuclease-like (RecB) superfamily
MRTSQKKTLREKHKESNKNKKKIQSSYIYPFAQYQENIMEANYEKKMFQF